MNSFSIKKKLRKDTGERKLLYSEGNFVEVICKDGFTARGNITKIEDDRIFIKKDTCELEIKIVDLEDILNKNPYSL